MTQQTNPQASEELREYLKGKSFQVGLEDLSTPKANYYYLSYEAIDKLMQHINQEVQKALSMVDVPRKYSTDGYSTSGGKGPTLIAHNKAVNQVTASINKIKEQYND